MVAKGDGTPASSPISFCVDALALYLQVKAGLRR
jgi:hypothetical protein